MDLVEWRRTEAEQTSWNRAVMPSLPTRASRAQPRFGTGAIRADAERKSGAQREVPSLAGGDRVSHDAFGMGTVVAVNGVGDKAQAEVDFGSGGTKRLVLRYAPLVKL